MQIENHFPFVIIVSTYDVCDCLYWVPVETQKLGPCTTGAIRAHDAGRCKVKIEILDGPRTWILDRPDDRVYLEGDTLKIGQSAFLVPAPGPARGPARAPAAREAVAAAAG